jgi:regulator of RNase E activity RraA
MKLWSGDEELYALARKELFTAVVGDIMDTLGLQRQFLPPQVRPLRPDMVLVGRVMTVLEADVLTDQSAEFHAGPLARPFGLMLAALDDLKPGEVYLSSGAAGAYALWGELMTTRALKLGAAGAVLNGYLRDTKGILKLKFPCFSHGSYAQDQGPRGKVLDYRVPLDVGGVRIAPGDIVFGDVDGVCLVPRAAEKDVFAKALEKVRGEEKVRKAIENGMSASEAFARYGIL